MAVRKRLRHWELAGFLTVCAVGTALRFLYGWTGGSAFAAPFAAVNESTWERMKTLFVPYFVFTLAEYPAFADALRGFFAVKAAAGVTGLLLIPTLCFTVSGAFGALPAWANAAIFYIAAAAAYLVSLRLLPGASLRGALWQAAGFALLWALAFLFVRFTYRPPQIPLFLDPQTLRCGIP